MLPTISFEATALDFRVDEQLTTRLYLVAGLFRLGDQVIPAQFDLEWGADGRWLVRSLRWLSDQALARLPDGAPEAIANLCARILTPTNLWSELAENGGSRMLVGFGRVEPNIRNRMWASHRAHAIQLRVATWISMWDSIENRVDFDDAFFVSGFTQEEIKSAIRQLRLVFPADWVAARFREMGGDHFNFELSLEAETYFPAYHLARTASGALCCDPGWKYLIEIGLALEKLREHEGFERLRRRVASSPGTQHHLCAAAEMHDRGLLVGLEPEVGVGAARNDLLIAMNGHRYQVELKEFSSATPIRQLERELLAKSQQLPERPTTPLVFHVVLLERRVAERIAEEHFCEQVSGILENVPKNISAIIVGRRFLDSSGGRILRDCLRTFLIPDAIAPTSIDELAALFPPNYNEIVEPRMSFLAPMQFGSNTAVLGEDNAAE